jgi:hypothetical protein
MDLKAAPIKPRKDCRYRFLALSYEQNSSVASLRPLAALTGLPSRFAPDWVSALTGIRSCGMRPRCVARLIPSSHLWSDNNFCLTPAIIAS